MGSGSLLALQVKKAKQFFLPLDAAGEVEGSRSFNVQNQVGTPGWECARGVCDAGSPWVAECQAYIAGKDVIASGVENQNNFADLFPFAGGDREGRKPFISGRKVQAYVMVARCRISQRILRPSQQASCWPSSCPGRMQERLCWAGVWLRMATCALSAMLRLTSTPCAMLARILASVSRRTARSSLSRPQTTRVLANSGCMAR